MARPAEIFPPLLDRLNAPHPSVQRFTVDVIFARFAAPSTAPQTCAPAREALTACLTHATSAVVDQSVTALCGLVQSGHCNADEALAHLLAALPAVRGEVVGSVCAGVVGMYVACVRDDVACARGDVAPAKGDADAREGRKMQQKGGIEFEGEKEGRGEQRAEVQWRWTGGTHPFTRVSMLPVRQ
ncbi:unnamed protein product [Closterium sp. Yama58-4]|nr:unnamed protein product [Closterium sp. Yama58-4]